MPTNNVCEKSHPNLFLIKDGTKVSMVDWSKEIFDELILIAECLDNNNGQYKKAVNIMRERLNDTSKTPSARIIDEVNLSNITFNELGNTIGELNKSHFLNLDRPNSFNSNKIVEEAKNSLDQQRTIEKNYQESFESFMENYFKN